MFLIFLGFCVFFTFWVPCCGVRNDFRIKTIFGSSWPPVVCRRAHTCLIYVICVCLLIVVSNTCCVMFLFLCTLYMLPVSLGCPIWIGSLVFSNVYLSTLGMDQATPKWLMWFWKLFQIKWYRCVTARLVLYNSSLKLCTFVIKCIHLYTKKNVLLKDKLNILELLTCIYVIAKK